jgi:hypothetical protein
MEVGKSKVNQGCVRNPGLFLGFQVTWFENQPFKNPILKKMDK